MRLRKKHWARPELEESKKVITEPKELQGNWNKEFGNEYGLHLELGVGKGGFIAEKAKIEPNVNFIGMELKNEVLVCALRKVKEAQLENVRLIPMNITGIDGVFAQNEIDKIYINFCNPWPKDRHNKRRLTHPRFLTEYKKFLKLDGEVWFKTDDTELFEASREYFENSGFSIEYFTYDLHNSDFTGNIMTEYESKFAAFGMKTMFLIAKLIG